MHFVQNFNWAGIGFCFFMLALVIGAGLASNGLRRQPSCGDGLDPYLPHEPRDPDPEPEPPKPEPHERHLVDFDSSRFTVSEDGKIEAVCCVPYCLAVVELAPSMRRATVVHFPVRP